MHRTLKRSPCSIFCNERALPLNGRFCNLKKACFMLYYHWSAMEILLVMSATKQPEVCNPTFYFTNGQETVSSVFERTKGQPAEIIDEVTYSSFCQISCSQTPCPEKSRSRSFLICSLPSRRYSPRGMVWRSLLHSSGMSKNGLHTVPNLWQPSKPCMASRGR